MSKAHSFRVHPRHSKAWKEFVDFNYIWTFLRPRKTTTWHQMSPRSVHKMHNRKIVILCLHSLCVGPDSSISQSIGLHKSNLIAMKSLKLAETLKHEWDDRLWSDNCVPQKFTFCRFQLPFFGARAPVEWKVRPKKLLRNKFKQLPSADLGTTYFSKLCRAALLCRLLVL